jgi:hypothetical protein
MLIAPLHILSWVTGIHDREAIITTFIAVFLGILQGIMRGLRPFELLAATAA